MGWDIRGIIEGFYGRPWTWDERAEVMAWCAERAMTHYVYAPKDDPRHRERWREPYDREDLDGFARLVAEGTLTVGFAISPGLDLDHRSTTDRSALRAKVDSVVDLGVGLVVLAFDDIPFDPGAGVAHAEITTELAGHLAGRASVALVPTEYVGGWRTRYLEALAAGVPDDVPIAWTGPAVVNDAITSDDARGRADALDGRPPLLWDNYPVNDAFVADRLFLGPLTGRDPGLAEVCSGYLANPMVQPRCSKLPLASVAAWLRGEDPAAAWEVEVGDLRVFAEACDGSVPTRLVSKLSAAAGPDRAVAARPLAEWLEAAASCLAPGLQGEADPWLDQVHREARLGLDALELIESPDPGAAVATAVAVATRWPRARRAEHTVMGPRTGFRPVLGAGAEGGWRVHRSSFEHDANAIDALVRLALAGLDDGPLSA